MSKLYFYYGTVCSSKTLNLLAVYKNYEIQKRKALLIRPECDTRSKNVTSRAGLSADPDIILNNNSSVYDELLNYFNKNSIDLEIKIPELILKTVDAIIVDECQFLTTNQIKELRQISLGISALFTDFTKTTGSKILKISHQSFKDICNKNELIISIPVLCYGLRTDSTGALWDSSAILMAQSDEIHEIKTVCSFCNKRAVFSSINPEYLNKNDSNDVFNPSWDYFIPVCPEHYFFINGVK